MFVTGRWEIVQVNLKLLMVGRYPADELDRLAVGLAGATLVGGLLAGVVHRRQVAARAPRPPPDRRLARRALGLAGRVWPVALGALLLLGLTDTIGPWVTAGLVVIAGVVGRVVGGHLPRRFHPVVVVLGLATPFGLVWFLARAAGWDEWGGMMLNVFIAVVAIVLWFPSACCSPWAGARACR